MGKDKSNQASQIKTTGNNTWSCTLTARLWTKADNSHKTDASLRMIDSEAVLAPTQTWFFWASNTVEPTISPKAWACAYPASFLRIFPAFIHGDVIQVVCNCPHLLANWLVFMVKVYWFHSGLQYTDTCARTPKLRVKYHTFDHPHSDSTCIWNLINQTLFSQTQHSQNILTYLSTTSMTTRFFPS